MSMKPMLFNTEMVRALLDGRKSVTRRVVKFRPGWNPKWTGYIPDGPVLYGSNNIPAVKAPYRPGDILYVREAWQYKRGGGYLYKADYIDSPDLWITPDGRVQSTIPWRPSIHMPKEAARLFLRVTGVRVERLQDITEEEIIKEGLGREPLDEVGRDFFRGMFSDVWDSTIKKSDLPLYGWDANPWVWVIEFERCEEPERAHGHA